MSLSRTPPIAVKRELRKEANFGCAYCGSPIIQYHHIIPWSVREHHEPEHMIALCLNCHEHAGPDAEALVPDRLYELKENPHIEEITQNEFYYESRKPSIKFGGNEFVLKRRSEMTVVKIERIPIVKIRFEDGMLQLDTKLFNQDGELLAEISRNEWTAYPDPIWDLEYRANFIKIWHEPRDIGLEIRYDSSTDKVRMRGNLYYRGLLVKSTMDEITVGGITSMEGSFTDVPVGVRVKKGGGGAPQITLG